MQKLVIVLKLNYSRNAASGARTQYGNRLPWYKANGCKAFVKALNPVLFEWNHIQAAEVPGTYSELVCRQLHMPLALNNTNSFSVVGGNITWALFKATPPLPFINKLTMRAIEIIVTLRLKYIACNATRAEGETVKTNATDKQHI